MTCVECRKNRADQMKELLCDNKKNCEEAYQDGYNQALEDFYNGLADELLWIRERFGDDVYMDVWCSVGCLQNKLTK